MKSEEDEERMKFIDFNSLFMKYSKDLTSHSDISFLCPYCLQHER